MKLVDVLIKSRALIAHESPKAIPTAFSERRPATGHTQFAVFRNAHNICTNKVSEATCFCSVGAVMGVLHLDREDVVRGVTKKDGAGRKQFHLATKYIAAAARSLGLVDGIGPDRGDTITVVHSNDNNSHADVLRMYDLAIKNAKRRHVNGGRYA